MKQAAHSTERTREGSMYIYAEKPESCRRIAGNRVVQPKLKISSPDDTYEQEANHVANQIMEVSEPPLQRSCSCGGSCPGCQRKPHGAIGEQTALPAVDDVLNSPGHPLDPAVAAFMQSRFDHDLSPVRVHTDAQAANAADAINARAFTHKNHIVFGRDQYQPTSTGGKRLLAHELAHVVQQAGPSAQMIQRAPPPKQTVTPPQLTQQLYSQAIASIASKTGVNATLLAVLRQGQVGQTVTGVHSASSTLTVTIPPPQGSTGPSTSAPAIRVVFDLEISPTTSPLPQGAFAAFDNNPAAQTTFTGSATTTGQTITRLLRIISKAPTGANAADTLGEALIHEGTHMLLAMDSLLSNAHNITPLAGGTTGAQTSFNRYLTAAMASSRLNPLTTSLAAEITRVIPTTTTQNASQMATEALTGVLEERFATDQQTAAYPRTVSNATIVQAYLWDMLATATSRTSWPRGPNATALETATLLLLNDVTTTLTRPATPTPGAGTPQQPTPQPTSPGTP